MKQGVCRTFALSGMLRDERNAVRFCRQNMTRDLERPNRRFPPHCTMEARNPCLFHSLVEAVRSNMP